MFRRTTAVTVIAALVALAIIAFGSPAAANKPLTIFERNVLFDCGVPGVRTDDGVVLIGASDSTNFNEPSASINYWVPPETPETHQDSTYRSSSLITDQQVTRTGYHFDGVLLMEDRDFNPVGQATFLVDLIPTGVVEEATPKKSRFGNRTIRDYSSVEFFTVAGSVTMHDGVVFDLTNCGGPDGSPPENAGFDTTVDIRISDPSQFVISFGGVLVTCDVVTSDYFLNLGASNENGPQTSLFFQDASRTLFGSSDGITLTADEFSGTIPMFDDDTGEPAGEAVVDVTLSRGDHVVLRTESDGISSTQIGNLLIPSGTITIPTEPATVVDLSSCFAFDGREQQKEHRPDEVPEE